MENLNDMINQPAPSCYEVVDAQTHKTFVQRALVFVAFQGMIRKMNSMYQLPVNDVPHLSPDLLGTPTKPYEEPSERIGNFLKTLKEELDEGEDIKNEMAVYEAKLRHHNAVSFTSCEAEADAKSELESFKLKILTDLSDWLGDIQVYCRSEALKFGLPLEAVQAAIMASNFSKLGADGKPIVNENGKVEKGPNFRKPEPFIQYFIADAMKTDVEWPTDSNQVDAAADDTSFQLPE